MKSVVWVAVVGLISSCSLVWAQENAKDEHADQGGVIRVAVITGGHGFDEAPFLELFKSIKGIEFVHLPQQDDSEFLEDIENWPYDVIVLYNMSRDISEKRQANFLKLLDKGVGLVVLHHAIANYPDWPKYKEIIGAAYFLDVTEYEGAKRPRSEYTHGVEMPIHVENTAHPVTQGVSDFTVTDETYRKWVFLPGSELLLSTTHPESNREIAWVRQAGHSRVCFIQLGHGPQAFSDENYRRLVGQAIAWTAK